LTRPPPLPAQQPQHPEALDEDERRALFVVGQCALNETFANAYLTTGVPRHHEPAGPRGDQRSCCATRSTTAAWAGPSSPPLPASRRARISDWLVPLTLTNLREWQQSAATHTLAHAPHGVPRAEAVREALAEVVRDVMLPGFEYVGLDTRALARWVRAGMPTE
jgi:hypothetical protein